MKEFLADAFQIWYAGKGDWLNNAFGLALGSRGKRKTAVYYATAAICHSSLLCNIQPLTGRVDDSFHRGAHSKDCLCYLSLSNTVSWPAYLWYCWRIVQRRELRKRTCTAFVESRVAKANVFNCGRERATPSVDDKKLFIQVGRTYIGIETYFSNMKFFVFRSPAPALALLA